MADVEANVAVAGQPPKKRTFKKFSFRGVDLDALLTRRVGEAKKRHRSDTGVRRVLPVSVSDTGTLPKMACRCNLECDLAGQISVAAGKVSSTFGPSQQRSRVESETESVNPAGSIDVQKSSSPMNISPYRTGQAKEASLLTKGLEERSPHQYTMIMVLVLVPLREST